MKIEHPVSHIHTMCLSHSNLPFTIPFTSFNVIFNIAPDVDTFPVTRYVSNCRSEKSQEAKGRSKMENMEIMNYELLMVSIY